MVLVIVSDGLRRGLSIGRVLRELEKNFIGFADMIVLKHADGVCFRLPTSRSSSEFGQRDCGR